MTRARVEVIRTCTAGPKQRQALARHRGARARMQHLHARSSAISPGAACSCRPALQRTSPRSWCCAPNAKLTYYCSNCERISHAHTAAPGAPMRFLTHTAPDPHCPLPVCRTKAARRACLAMCALRVARRARRGACALRGVCRTCFIFSVRWSSTWHVIPDHARSAGYCTARLAPSASPPEALLMHTHRSPVPSWGPIQSTVSTGELEHPKAARPGGLLGKSRVARPAVRDCRAPVASRRCPAHPRGSVGNTVAAEAAGPG